MCFCIVTLTVSLGHYCRWEMQVKYLWSVANNMHDDQRLQQCFSGTINTAHWQHGSKGAAVIQVPCRHMNVVSVFGSIRQPHYLTEMLKSANEHWSMTQLAQKQTEQAASQVCIRRN